MFRVFLAIVILSMTAFHASAGGQPESRQEQLCPPAEVATVATEARAPLEVRSWVCLLQADAMNLLPKDTYDTVVMDYSRDGTEHTRYTSADISRLHARGYRNVLSYLSIGEAESYRYYFKSSWIDRSGNPSADAPCWLGRLNPDWPGNYKTQYWAEEWQQIILGYLDRIIDAGFDGVYLDIVDAYEYWSAGANGESVSLDRQTAADYMMRFIERLAAHARARNPNFHVVMQNAEQIFSYDTDGAFLRTIDGIGIEDLYYNERVPESNEWIDTRVRYLNQVRDAGKTVMVMDYVYAGSRSDRLVRDFIRRADAAGYVPYPAWKDRKLDRVTPAK